MVVVCLHIFGPKDLIYAVNKN